MKIGNNVDVEVDGSKMVITVDLSVEGTPSSSGKSLVIGSTQGNKKVGEGDSEVTVGLNVYKSNKKGA